MPFEAMEPGWHVRCGPAKLILVSDRAFYSDRTGQPVPRVKEEVTANAWRGLVAVIQSRLADGYFAHAFPICDCPDGSDVTGTSDRLLVDSLRAHVPEASDRPFLSSQVPSTTVALDILDFLALKVEQPSGRKPHDWWRHEHLFFSSDQEWKDRSVSEFCDEVDLIFARNGIAFAFGKDMRTYRLGPPEARQLMSSFRPMTGDLELDAKLADAVARFESRRAADRQDALEKLWDALERLKTLESPNKKVSVPKLLANAVTLVVFRERLEAEFATLTDIGNKFAIRHHERNTPELPDNETRDYLFIRLAALIAYVLRRTGRMEQ